YPATEPSNSGTNGNECGAANSCSKCSRRQGVVNDACSMARTASRSLPLMVRIFVCFMDRHDKQKSPFCKRFIQALHIDSMHIICIITVYLPTKDSKHVRHRKQHRISAGKGLPACVGHHARRDRSIQPHPA